MEFQLQMVKLLFQKKKTFLSLCWGWFSLWALTWEFYFSIYQHRLLAQLTCAPPLPSSACLHNFPQHIEKLPAFSETQCLPSECRCSSKLGGQGTKEEMHYIYRCSVECVAWRITCNKWKHREESEQEREREGDKVSEGGVKKKKIEECAHHLQICCVK